MVEVATRIPSIALLDWLLSRRLNDRNLKFRTTFPITPFLVWLPNAFKIMRFPANADVPLDQRVRTCLGEDFG